MTFHVEIISMTPEGRIKLRKLLLLHEGLRTFPYLDSLGNSTIGIGRSLTTRGITVDEAFFLMDDDVVYFLGKLNGLFPWFFTLDENRQLALVDMCFCLGVNGLLNFKKMLAAFAVKDYALAAIELMNSKFAQQTGQRAIDLAQIVRSGELTLGNSG